MSGMGSPSPPAGGGLPPRPVLRFDPEYVAQRDSPAYVARLKVLSRLVNRLPGGTDREVRDTAEALVAVVAEYLEIVYGPGGAASRLYGEADDLVGRMVDAELRRGRQKGAGRPWSR